MKTSVKEPPQYLVDAQGHRVAVVLDLPAYERLLEAAEETWSVRAYDAAKPVVEEELKAGEATTLNEYKTARSRSRR